MMSAISYRCHGCDHDVMDGSYSEWYVLCRSCAAADDRLVGDKDRDNAITRLTAAHAGGYLSQEKLDERVTLLLQPDITQQTVKKALAGTPKPGVIVLGSPLPWWKRISRVSFALGVLVVILFALLMAGVTP